MRKAIVVYVVILLMVLSAAVVGAQAPDRSQLDPKPYDPATEPHIDMYMGSWLESMPRHTHGSLIERDILTRGNPQNPTTKGAVLIYAGRFTHATLPAHASTVPTVLEGEQEVLYILTGEGSVTAAGKTSELFPGIGVLVPENIEFVMKSTGDEPLTMYLLSDPVPEGFKGSRELLVVDENKRQFGKSNPHWVGLSKSLFNKNTGLATIGNILTVRFDPMTFFQPHSHREGQEEVWTAVYGEIHFLLGKQIRKQPPGTAYYIPPNGKTPHANFNVSDEMVKLFYFSTLN